MNEIPPDRRHERRHKETSQYKKFQIHRDRRVGLIMDDEDGRARNGASGAFWQKEKKLTWQRQ